MNRYLLFSGDRHGPSGGMEDFTGSDNDVHKLMSLGERYQWAHIFDTKACRIVCTLDAYNFDCKGCVDFSAEWEITSISPEEFSCNDQT